MLHKALIKPTRTILFVGTITLLSVLAACASNRAENADTHTSQSALDWSGSYTGLLPCADCPGIQIKLILRSNGNYELSTLYQDHDTQPQISRGHFRWLPDGNTIELDDRADQQRWRVGENQLTMIAPDGSLPTGELAPHYVLHRQSP